MDNNIMGFIGVEVTDIILYLSRILYHLDKRILICDLSSNKELIHSIPNMMELPLIHYNGVDITNMLDRSYVYDHVFIYYGFSYDDTLKNCNRLIITSDMSRNHISCISNIYKELLNKYSNFENSFLFVKVFESKIKIEYILERIDSKIDFKTVYSIYADLEDMKASIVNQYNKEITFRKISPSFKQFLLEMVKKLEPHSQHKQLYMAYKKAERGYI